MANFNMAQTLPFVFGVEDGFHRPVGFDEAQHAPVVASSDETVATAEVSHFDDGSWHGVVHAVSPGDARISVVVDADMTDEVSDITGMLDVHVDPDPRGLMRVVFMTAGEPVNL